MLRCQKKEKKNPQLVIWIVIYPLHLRSPAPNEPRTVRKRGGTGIKEETLRHLGRSGMRGEQKGKEQVHPGELIRLEEGK